MEDIAKPRSNAKVAAVNFDWAKLVNANLQPLAGEGSATSQSNCL
jgi:hypothetical protein